MAFTLGQGGKGEEVRKALVELAVRALGPAGGWTCRLRYGPKLAEALVGPERWLPWLVQGWVLRIL